jgi:ABC-type spermidine/putrescine transport system permease subunit II
MLVFVLSFDDFITTFFTAGVGVPPLPLRIYGMLRYGVTPIVNAVGMLMLVIAIGAIGVAFLMMRFSGSRSSGRIGTLVGG